MNQTLLEPILIDVESLMTLLESRQPITILDVRPLADWVEWSIPGSQHVDACERLKAEDPNALSDVELPGDGDVITVCGAGKASLTAAEQLRANGIRAFSLAGGMNAWSLAWNTAEIPVPSSSCSVIQVRRVGKGCLSYIAGSDGEAVVVDASLDPEIYLGLARGHGWAISHVVDTHVHADHLSRSPALAKLTGATLHLPAQNRISFPFASLDDGVEISFGRSRLMAIATPGHTMEAMTYLIDDRALMTGDTLFLSGVGRPDLEASPEEATTRARLLYRSLQKLALLPGETVVLPGHTSEPIGFDNEPIALPLREVLDQVDAVHLPEVQFVLAITSRIPPAPPNHSLIIKYNEAGTQQLGDLINLEAGANRCAVS